jgi:hypothetical protein
MALNHGLATAPAWVRILDAAEAWGKLPWEIVGKPGALIWYLRFCVSRDLRISAEKAEINKMKRDL